MQTSPSPIPTTTSTVTLTVAGLLAQDTVAIRDQGAGAGQIGVAGSDVNFGGSVIGSFAGGAGGTLTVTFNAAATAAGIEALIETLTYADSSDAPAASRSLELKVTDAAGFAATIALLAEQTGVADPLNGIDVGSSARRASPTSTATATSTPSRGTTAPELFREHRLGHRAGLHRAHRHRQSIRRRDVGYLGAPASRSRRRRRPRPRRRGQVRRPDYSRTPARPSRPPSRDHRRRRSVQRRRCGERSTPASPTSTATATSTPSSGNCSATALCREHRLGQRAGLHRAHRRRQSVQRRRCGDSSTPSFADLDGDGDLDAVVGELNGALRYFENTGSASAPAFTARTGAANPFDGVDVGSFGTPSFADLTATASSTPSSGRSTAPALFPEHDAAGAGFRGADRRRQSIQRRRCRGLRARRASPTSTATATSTPSPGNPTAT